MRGKSKIQIIAIRAMIFLIACAFIGCESNKKHNATIYLPSVIGGRNEGLSIGEYDIVSESPYLNNRAITYEVMHEDQEGLLEFFRNSEYFVGEFELKDSIFLDNADKRLNIGQEAIFLVKEGFAWICQANGNKRVNVVSVSNINVGNEEDDLHTPIKKIIISSREKSLVYDIKYNTPLTWEELKSLYPKDRINEEEKTIDLYCVSIKEGENGYYGKGIVKLIFNESNGTIMVSSDYTIIGKVDSSTKEYLFW